MFGSEFLLKSLKDVCLFLSQSIDKIKKKVEEVFAIKFNFKKLQQKSIAAGFNIDFHIFDQIDSTNSEAKRVGRQLEHITQPHVFIANRQTAGYGRLKRDFYSPEDSGLYISFLIPVVGKTFNPGLLTTMTAVASAEAIQKHFSVQLQIKWVNDLILNKRKVGGILAEAITDPITNQLAGVVIGIGVNLYTQSFPAEIQQIATSLSDQAEAKDQTDFLADFVNNFLNHLKTYQNADFMSKYRQLSSVIGQQVQVQFQNKTVVGVVETIDDQGRLILQTTQQRLVISSGEIIHVSPTKSN